MRACLAAMLFFFSAGLYWSLQPAVQSRQALRRLEEGHGNPLEQLNILRRAGPDAAYALKTGLSSENARVRLVCARELARLGDLDGDNALLEMLRDRASPERQTLASAAETFLVDTWNARSAPPQAQRNAVLQISAATASIDARLERLSRLLDSHPLWTQGLIFRARLLIALDRAAEARRDALTALLIQPDQFEAMVVLARAWAVLGRPDYSVVCMERAVTVNPRLKDTLRDELQAFYKLLERERGKVREEVRKLKPFA